jgi:hypothetical protein
MLSSPGLHPGPQQLLLKTLHLGLQLFDPLSHLDAFWRLIIDYLDPTPKQDVQPLNRVTGQAPSNPMPLAFPHDTTTIGPAFTLTEHHNRHRVTSSNR